MAYSHALMEYTFCKMGYNTTTIAAAFSTVARLVNAGQPVILSKIEGLNSMSQGYFKTAVTRTFTEKNDGFNLQRIFIVDKENPVLWHRNTSPNKNPTDVTLIDLITQAMSYVAKVQRENRKSSKDTEETTQPIQSNMQSVEDIDKEIERLQTLKKKMIILQEKQQRLAFILEKSNLSLEELTQLIKDCSE